MKRIEIGDEIETDYGNMVVTDIEIHDFDYPTAHIDTRLIENE